MNNVFRFKIAIQTIKNHWKTTIIITLLFMIMAVGYAGMFPAFKESIIDMMDSDFYESFNFLPHANQMHTYVGFLTLELYAIFWLLILAIMLGFIAASSISTEIEGKTIDILMSNPVSRKQIVIEKFVGLIPMFLVVNFGMMLAVIGITAALNESLDFGNLFLVHILSIPYFLAVLSLGILISVIIDEKMKSSIILILILVGMFVLNSLSLTAPDYNWLGSFSFSHYFDTYTVLEFGEVDFLGIFVFILVTIICLVSSMIYFEYRDITIS
jgi:ABC-2 type transport system permease protein